MVFDVAVKLLDKWFKWLNIVGDLAFKLFTDNVELVDKLSTFVVNANTGILAPVDNAVVVNYVELSAIKLTILILIYFRY